MGSGETIERALDKARNHWLELYGHEANEAVIEAAMTWLAKDVWPQSDQSEGRIFTWSLASVVIESLATGWLQGPPNFERIMVMAGVLEDPFSTSTLEIRLPTLIRRFVNRFRKRRQGTSFQTLEHTMTLHGALKLLNLPTAPGHRLTLSEIREGYRELALKTHPDSGGSEEGMRKVNEAYQLLKELYRKE
ncbi:DnaJ domain-containing protein [Cyanobium sp. WAJ14-Wanaka]|uniref:DnaJ domain-containing protein n=1 Tax=Cyanobium sp. WAJ14-Wanaka TaxID=2823725 RepID=UPI0020CFE7FF|nr:DnaJ domain-containing protein [Cyanobium sp. WAJ14-Wanaka]